MRSGATARAGSEAGPERRPRAERSMRLKRPTKSSYLRRVEGIEHRLSGSRALRLQQGAHCDQGFAVCLGYIREPSIELLQLNVEIADGAKRVANPSEIVAKLFRRRREKGSEQRQGGTQASARDAHVMQLLAVIAKSRAGSSRAGRRTGAGAQPAPHDRSGHPPRLEVEPNATGTVLETGCKGARLVVRQLRGLQPARVLQSFD